MGLSRIIQYATSLLVRFLSLTVPMIYCADDIADPLARATALIKLFTLEEKLNNTGHVSPGVPRLGLPAYTWWQEALHGVASSPGVNFSDSGPFSIATSFPQPILMGAAFDDQLITDVATVISTEARAFNNVNRAGLDFWTPNIVGLLSSSSIRMQFSGN